MKESNFQLEMRHAIQHYYPNAHYEKIPDQPRFGGEKIRYPVLRPYDAFTVIKGSFFAFEYKMHKKPLGFYFDRVSDKQIERLKSAKKAAAVKEGGAFILINCRYIYKGQKYNFVLPFDIDDFVDIRKSYEQQGKKSLPLEAQLEFLKDKVALERQGSFWDIPKLVGGL